MALTQPSYLTTAFANTGAKNTIPVPVTGSNLASWEIGFPPITMIPKTSGGEPPEGKDFNGIFNSISSHTVWQNAGGQYKFNSALATAIGGYSIGMVLQNDAGTASYYSAINNNTGNFNSNPALIGVSWMPSSGAAVLPIISRTARTSNTIIAATDRGKFFDVTSGTFTQTLTAAATLGDGFYCYYRNSGTGVVTIDPNASETINGVATLVLPPGTQIIIQCNGTAFFTPVNSVAISGGTMTGPLILSADPATALGAATKQYVDAAAPVYVKVAQATPSAVASQTLTLGSWQSTYKALVFFFDLNISAAGLSNFFMYFNATGEYALSQNQFNASLTITYSGSESNNIVLATLSNSDQKVYGCGEVINPSGGAIRVTARTISIPTVYTMTGANKESAGNPTTVTFAIGGGGSFVGRITVYGVK